MGKRRLPVSSKPDLCHLGKTWPSNDSAYLSRGDCQHHLLQCVSYHLSNAFSHQRYLSDCASANWEQLAASENSSMLEVYSVGEQS